MTTLRVRFDLRAAGEVWIDDVSLYDLAFSDTERAELSKLVAAAQVSLKQRRPAECRPNISTAIGQEVPGAANVHDVGKRKRPDKAGKTGCCCN